MVRNRAWHSLRRKHRCDSHQHIESKCHNATHSHLYKLPAELLDMVYQHLTFEASIALALTCARFYHSPIFTSIRQDLRSTKLAKFAALCMFENDRAIKGYCCQGCLTRHSSAAFSQDELEKLPAERYCLVTKKCLRLNSIELSFADIKNTETEREKGKKEKKSRPIRLFNDFAKPFSSPKKTITTLRMFPIEAGLTKERFAALSTRLNTPLCPHMRLGDKEVTELYRIKLFISLPPPRRPGGSHKCKRCQTRVALTRTLDPETGIDWCVLKIHRALGRLFSPLEPTWLAHTFASKDPYLDEYMKVTDAWFGNHWAPSHFPWSDWNDLAELDNLQPDNDRLFTPITLPTTLSSLMARLSVRAWLIATWVPGDFRNEVNA